jgi:uncharacterized protein YihD (DUF1040 family)
VRDPARIARMLALLRTAWLRDPDMRLGQLMSNLFDDAIEFHIEDDRTEELLRVLVEGGWSALQREILGVKP